MIVSWPDEVLGLSPTAWYTKVPASACPDTLIVSAPPPAEMVSAPLAAVIESAPLPRREGLGTPFPMPSP